MEVVVAAWFPFRRNIYDENRHIKYNYVSVWSSSGIYFCKDYGVYKAITKCKSPINNNKNKIILTYLTARTV